MRQLATSRAAPLRPAPALAGAVAQHVGHGVDRPPVRLAHLVQQVERVAGAGRGGLSGVVRRPPAAERTAPGRAGRMQDRGLADRRAALEVEAAGFLAQRMSSGPAKLAARPKARRLLPTAGAATSRFHSAKVPATMNFAGRLGLQDDGLAAGAEGAIRQHEPLRHASRSGPRSAPGAWASTWPSRFRAARGRPCRCPRQTRAAAARGGTRHHRLPSQRPFEKLALAGCGAGRAKRGGCAGVQEGS